MKNLLFFAAQIVSGLTFAACSVDDNIASEQGESGKSAKCDIVLMYYGWGAWTWTISRKMPL